MNSNTESKKHALSFHKHHKKLIPKSLCHGSNSIARMAVEKTIGQW